MAPFVRPERKTLVNAPGVLMKFTISQNASTARRAMPR